MIKVLLSISLLSVLHVAFLLSDTFDFEALPFLLIIVCFGPLSRSEFIFEIELSTCVTFSSTGPLCLT